MIAGAEFKLKYAGSALGYVWSVVKPLALFAVLYVVFGRIFKLGADLERLRRLPADRDRALHVLLGRDHDGHVVARRPRSRCCASCRFPRLVIPMAATLTAAMTFGVNLSSSPASSPGTGSSPRLEWLLLIPLLLELYLFIARHRADPGDAVRALPRHRAGVGARAPAAVLRLADHLPDRLSCRPGRQPRVPEPVHPGAAGHPRDRALPGSATNDHGRRTSSARRGRG